MYHFFAGEEYIMVNVIIIIISGTLVVAAGLLC